MSISCPCFWSLEPISARKRKWEINSYSHTTNKSSKTFRKDKKTLQVHYSEIAVNLRSYRWLYLVKVHKILKIKGGLGVQV